MSEATKACPYCGEQILPVAIKCKHCGSMLGGNSSPAGVTAATVVKRQFTMRPAFVIPFVVILLLLGLGVALNWNQTHTVSGAGYSDSDVANIEQDIRAKLATQRGITVEDVQLIRESPTRLTGFAKVRVPLLGTVNKTCSATLGEDRQSIWQCK